eukprot:4152397-Prymnesium_polylepis.1
MGWTWARRAMRDAALVGAKRASMVKSGGEVQARLSGTATPACDARGGRPTIAPFARLCAPYEKKTATVRVAPCCESRSNADPDASCMR